MPVLNLLMRKTLFLPFAVFTFAAGYLFKLDVVLNDFRLTDELDDSVATETTIDQPPSVDTTIDQPPSARSSLEENNNNAPLTHLEQVDHFVIQNNNNITRSNKVNVFMSAPWVPTKLIQTSLQQDSSVVFRVFNDSAMAKSVKLIDQELREKEGIQGAFEAWSMLRPWAYRADLWRYMLLWSQGGIYVDNKVVFTSPLSKWATLEAPDQEIAICQDHNKTIPIKSEYGGGSIPVLWQGAMGGRKGSPLLLKAIRAAIDNVQQRRYTLEHLQKGHGEPWLDITGPTLLGFVAFYENDNANKQVRLDCNFKDRNARLWPAATTSTRVFYTDAKLHKKTHSQYKNQAGHYYILHKSKFVYCDDPKPTGKYSKNVPDPDPCDNVTDLLL